MRDKKIVILTVLGIAAVFSLIYGITAPPKGRRSFSPEATKVSASRVHEALSGGAVSTERRTRKTKFTSWGRDPFNPKIGSAAAHSDLVLQGILSHAGKPQAIINNDIIEVGDKIGRNTVVDIGKNAVILESGEEKFTLKLRE